MRTLRKTLLLCLWVGKQEGGVRPLSGPLCRPCLGRCWTTCRALGRPHRQMFAGYRRVASLMSSCYLGRLSLMSSGSTLVSQVRSVPTLSACSLPFWSLAS